MGNSLPDQLLKAGLVSEDQAKKARVGKRKARKHAGKGKGGKAPETASPAADAAARRLAAQRERDRALNLKREAQRAKKELRRRVRDLVVAAKVNVEDAEVPYHFTRGTSVKRLYVTAEQQDGLAAGRLAIVPAGGRHCLVPVETADKVREISPEHFVFRADTPAAAPGPDDEHYARFTVPDDLTW